MKSVNELIQSKVLTIATLPMDNGSEIRASRYVVPLIEHDYPAKTPVMWNAAYRAFNLDVQAVMLVGDADIANTILAVLKQDERYIGGGAGVGFKDEVLPHLDELDESARQVGAVNFMLKTPQGNLCGYNTDGLGFAEGLQELFMRDGERIAGKKAVLLGAGGTGNAIAFALAQKGMRLSILNRTVEKAEHLAKKINEFSTKKIAIAGSESDTIREVSDAHAIINVSTKGASGAFEKYSALAPAMLPASPEHIGKNRAEATSIMRALPKRAIVCDIVLGKKPTPLIEEATHWGFRTMDGIPMVINQGVEAFWILHGAELMEKKITKARVREVMKAAATS